MTAKLGQLTLIITIIAVGYFIFSVVQGSVKTGVTFNSTTSSLEIGLVGHWTFDGPNMDWSSASAEVKDISGNGNDGDALAGMSATTSSSIGKMGQAVHFDGSDDYIDIGDSFYSDIFSVCAWVNSDVSLSGTKTIVSKRNTSGISSGSNEWDLVSYQGYFSFGSWDSGISQTGLATTTDGLVPDTWYYVCGVQQGNGNDKLIYLDGVLSGSTAQVSAMRNTSAPIQIGVRTNNDNDRYWEGLIDDVRIYNRALSADEIAQLYNMGGNKVATTPSVPALETGLVGHWTFDGKDINWGSTTAEVQDMSGSGYNGDATSSMSSAVSNMLGVLGQGVKINSADEYITIGDVTELNNATQFTISTWARLDDFTTGGRMFRKYINDSRDIMLAFWSNDTIYLEVGTGSQNHFCTISNYSNIINEGEWFYLTFIFNGNLSGNDNRLKLFINGEQITVSGCVGTIPASTPDLSGEPLYIAKIRPADSNDEFYKGALDDFRIYNRALSADEIAQLYNMGGNKVATTPSVPALETGLVGHWTFDGPSMTTATATDVSGSGNDGTLKNSPTVSIGKFGQALTFDGSSEYINPGSGSSLDNISQLTTSFWVRRDNPTGRNDLVIAKRGAGPAGWQVMLRSTGKMRFAYAWSGRVWAEWELTTAQLTDPDKWYHIVITYNNSSTGNDPKMYVDGVSQSVTEIGGVPGGTPVSDASLGLLIANYASDYLDGSLDDVRIYNRVLSAEEVEQLYNMGR